MCNGAVSLMSLDDKHYHYFGYSYIKHIDMVADAGLKKSYLFSGNRRDIDDETGLINCEVGLKRFLVI